jgi:hypothetical protein
VNFQKGKVRPFFGSVHLALDFRGNEIETLYTPKEITRLMDVACAAHKPSHYDFGDGTPEIAVKDVRAGDEEEESDEDFD